MNDANGDNNGDGGNNGNGARYVELVDTFLKAWGDLSVFPPEKSKDPGATRRAQRDPIPQRAYLLFNRWEDNALAQGLGEKFPQWARDRVSVPDSYFEHREERAPFLLELPPELVLSSPGFKRAPVLAWLADCLEVAAAQAEERVTSQDLCGVVISPANEQAITRYWVGLGDQRAPYAEDSVLYRYQDARVMQRVWPALDPSQQTRWLGPVTQWWSLLQPWGPFSDPPEPAQWFQAKGPLRAHGAVAGGSPRDLFDEAQWFLSGVSPQANLIWRGYADNDVPPPAQPDAHSMVQMLEDGQRLGLGDLNLEDYVWTTWLQNPKEGPPRAMDWRRPHAAPTLNWIQEQLRHQPDVRFAALYNDAIRSAR